MKKISLLVSVFVLFAFYCSTQIDLDDEMMNGSTLMTMPGHTFVYEVDYYGEKYDFMVTVNEIGDGIKFDYEMTNAAKTKGSVSMSKDALENATVQNNIFSGGELDLTDQTTVWLSKKVFMDLVENGKSTISTDGGETETEIGDATPMHDYQIYNAISDETFDDISYIYVQSLDGAVAYWIHMSKYNPLILKMDIGWTITLKELRIDP